MVVILLLKVSEGNMDFWLFSFCIYESEGFEELDSKI